MKFLETCPKNIKLGYVVNGKRKGVDFTLYDGISVYLAEQPRFIDCENYDNYIRKKYLDDKVQKKYVSKLSEKIMKSENGDNRARAAVSIVQNIPYADNDTLKDMRYPYEVLLDFKGVCSEKSLLLAYLLRDIGFCTALFIFEKENHASVGIKCPEKYSFKNSGYCFVETNSPSIITDSQKEYEIGCLESAPRIIKICDGRQMETIGIDYRDAIEMNYLKKMFENSYKFNNNHANRIRKLAVTYGIDISKYDF